MSFLKRNAKAVVGGAIWAMVLAFGPIIGGKYLGILTIFLGGFTIPLCLILLCFQWLRWGVLAFLVGMFGMFLLAFVVRSSDKTSFLHELA